MGATRFKLRRVLIGVFVGLVAVSLTFYGWVQYRQSQYADRQRSVLTKYHDDYSLCIKLGNDPLSCARHVLAACTHDPFWKGDKPFAAAGSSPPDPVGSCRASAVTS
jgi:hypothetical protein